METSFVYFQLLKWVVHQGCFYQHRKDRNIVLYQPDAIFKVMFEIMLQLVLQKSYWSHQVDGE